MRGAHQSLLIALEWRRDGLDYIAQRIRTALGDSGDAADEAIQQIAGQMQVFLASDVDYETRVRPVDQGGARRRRDRRPGHRAVGVPAVDRLAAARRRRAASSASSSRRAPGRDKNEPTGPGLHGTNIDSVSYGDTTLQPGALQPAHLRGRLDVLGQVHQRRRQRRVRRQGDRPASRAAAATRSRSATRSTRSRRRPARPPTSPSRSRRRSAPRSRSPCASRRCPGEEKTDNNQAEYQAIFAEG